MRTRLLSDLETKVVTVFLYNEALYDQDVEVEGAAEEVAGREAGRMHGGEGKGEVEEPRPPGEGGVKRGKGVWKLNVGLLVDQEVAEDFTRAYTSWRTLQLCFPTRVEWWGQIKGNSLEQQTDFLKAELGVSRAEEAARAQEVVQLQHTLQHTDAEMECMHGQIAGLQHQLKESEGHIQALGMEKAQQQDAHRKEACELATGLEEVRLTLTDAFKQFERNSKKAQEDEDTITRLKEELKASKEELAASEAERASAQPELSTPQQGLSALQDQLTTSQAENEDTLRQVMLPASFPRPLRTQALLTPERPRV
ncbi:uncharacterized protein LOC142924556 [Petromyzon marinus]|uniref:uncharacterized protein LOC142924556 n=1 Tax=Petromyzon marinus TaxID=7757 RepID=UPI003F6F80C7